jgi:tetratricopeptide (TPR) repeat protein
MNRLFIIFSTLILSTGLLYAQEGKDTEYWRALGFEARLNGMPDSSLYYYNKVLEINPADWDALLATARLYYASGQIRDALGNYEKMIGNDSADIQALNGMGYCYTRLGDYDAALRCFDKALQLDPGFVRSMMGKAKITGDNGDLEGAIDLYEQVMTIDSTVAEAYDGKATMLYWSNRPYSALPLFRQALALDPGNTAYQQSIERMERILAWYIGLSYVNILEEEFWEGEFVYAIRGNVENLYVSKRANDWLSVRAGAMMDFSNKDIVDSPRVHRRFDSYSLSAQLIRRDHSLSLRYAYSLSDQVNSSYGISLNNSWKIKKLRINNTLGYNYDYFYYWNEVSRDFISDHLVMSFKRFRLESSLMTGKVHEALLFNADRDSTYLGENPFTIVRSSFSFTIIEKPLIALVVMHEWRDYNNRSPLYWSPAGRSLISPGLKISHEWGDWYAYGIINAGIDNSDVSNIDGSAELGRSFGQWLFALGYGAYSNIYYRNSVISAVIRLRI